MRLKLQKTEAGARKFGYRGSSANHDVGFCESVKIHDTLWFSQVKNLLKPNNVD